MDRRTAGEVLKHGEALHQHVLLEAVGLEVRVAVFSGIRLDRHGLCFLAGSDEQQVNLIAVINAETHGLALHVRRHGFRIDVDERAEDGVERDGVGGEQQHVHRRRRARAGAVALHGDDTVHDVQTGFHTAVDVDEHAGEDARVRELDVLSRLAVAAGEAEEVLHRARETHEGVGLHLADVDDRVRLGDLLREVKLLFGQSLRERHADLLIHRREGRAIDGFLRVQADLRCAFDAGVVTGGIAVFHAAAAALLQQAQHGADDGGVRGDGGVDLRGLEQIGLDEDLLLRADEPVHSAEGADAGADGLINRLRIVGITRDGDDRRAFGFHVILLFDTGGTGGLPSMHGRPGRSCRNRRRRR